MTDSGIRSRMQIRLGELEASRDRALQAYRDKDLEVNEATRELSERVRKLREERGTLALEAGSCQQKIDELRGLLNDTGDE
jgi:hypothetical protein